MNRIIRFGMAICALMIGTSVSAFCQDVSAASSTTVVRSNNGPILTDVCSILKNPSFYAMKEISLRGSIYMGVDIINISDKNCSGNAIKLVISDDVIRSKNIQSFYKKINNYGRHGVATVNGKFILNGSPLTPHVINVYSASDVSR